jgi:hypothetical protein
MWRLTGSATRGVVIALAILAAPTAVAAQPASAIAEDFTEEKVGAAPTSFSTPIGWWSMGTDGVDTKPVLFEDGTRYAAAARTNTLAAQAQAQAQGQNVHQFADSSLSYFPVALFNGAPSFTQGTITTQFAVVGGDLDNDAGVVFNYQPNGDFLALREDMDASSLILFSVVQGQQSNLSIIENVPGALARWHMLQLTVGPGGTHVTGSFDGQRLLDADPSAPISGQAGAIAKTDTVVVFNNFTVDPNGQ